MTFIKTNNTNGIVSIEKRPNGTKFYTTLRYYWYSKVNKTFLELILQIYYFNLREKITFTGEELKSDRKSIKRELFHSK